MVGSGVIDKNGREIKLGDKVRYPYVETFGGNIVDDIEGGVAEVIFETGAFLLKTEHEDVLLREWCVRTEGPYVSNYGNVMIYENRSEYLEVV